MFTAISMKMNHHRRTDEGWKSLGYVIRTVRIPDDRIDDLDWLADKAAEIVQQENEESFPVVVDGVPRSVIYGFDSWKLVYFEISLDPLPF